MFRRTALIVIGMCLVAGCAGSYTEQNFAVRLKAADTLSSVNDRDQACREIALNAAAIEQPRTVRRCLEKISDTNLRDQTALEAVSRLMKSRGHYATPTTMAAAREIAESIGNVPLRDQALKSIVTGQ